VRWFRSDASQELLLTSIARMSSVEQLALCGQSPVSTLFITVPIQGSIESCRRTTCSEKPKVRGRMVYLIRPFIF
jgi:hypothetical protein